VDDRTLGRLDALERQDRAEPELLQRQELKAPAQLCQVPERVRARIAVGGGIRERPTPQASMTITAARAMWNQ
jgi:hypothetical protein